MPLQVLDAIIAKLNRQALNAYLSYELRLRYGWPVAQDAKRFHHLDRRLGWLRKIRAELAMQLGTASPSS